jgi:hypothetical protein
MSADAAILAAMTRARPLVEEILSLWPAEMRRKLVVSIEVSSSELSVRARLRSATADGTGSKVEDLVRRVRGDAAIVFERPGEVPVVVPLQAMRRAA